MAIATPTLQSTLVKKYLTLLIIENKTIFYNIYLRQHGVVLPDVTEAWDTDYLSIRVLYIWRE